MKSLLNFSKKQRGNALLQLVKWQVSFGARYPGSTCHRNFILELAKYIEYKTDEFYKQNFEITLKGKRVLCTNLISVKKAHTNSLYKPLLLGTHFDTRMIADNEKNPELINKPILGANDGASGTAILLHLLDYLKEKQYKRDIYLVLFDAEDVGNIDGYDFAEGARFLADHPVPEIPGQVLILDMVGGKNMILDIDNHIFENQGSLKLANQILTIGINKGFAPFIQNKPHKYKYLICDHYPFLKKGIPAFVLMDIDYPQWHTQRDLPDAIQPESLAMIEEVVWEYLCQFEIDAV